MARFVRITEIPSGTIYLLLYSLPRLVRHAPLNRRLASSRLVQSNVMTLVDGRSFLSLVNLGYIFRRADKDEQVCSCLLPLLLLTISVSLPLCRVSLYFHRIKTAHGCFSNFGNVSSKPRLLQSNRYEYILPSSPLKKRSPLEISLGVSFIIRRREIVATATFHDSS